MAQSLLLGNKAAVITGAASKLGKTIAEKFVLQGAKVILADINGKQACLELQTSLNNKGPFVAHAVDCDVSKPNDVLAAVQAAKTQFKQQVDIFYNNAGAENQYRPAYSSSSIIDVDSFNKAMKFNVESMILSIKHASEAMTTSSSQGGAAAGGVILCNGSTVGSLGDVMPSWYSISKAALVDLVRAAAAELRSKGVRVNIISPHNVVANLEKKTLKQMFPEADNEDLNAMINRYKDNNMVSDEDVANAAVYLASANGKRINGQNFVLNGTFTLE